MHWADTLHVYDFDLTLFRSPEPAPGFSDEEWYQGGISLSPPIVPEVPGPEWWIEDTVAQMREDLYDRSRGVAVITARTEAPYRLRVGTLLQGAGLVPNCLELQDTDLDSPSYKVAKVWRIIQRFPGLSHVELHEDNPETLDRMEAFLKAQGRSFMGHLVRASAMPPAGLP